MKWLDKLRSFRASLHETEQITMAEMRPRKPSRRRGPGKRHAAHLREILEVMQPKIIPSMEPDSPGIFQCERCGALWKELGGSPVVLMPMLGQGTTGGHTGHCYATSVEKSLELIRREI